MHIFGVFVKIFLHDLQSPKNDKYPENNGVSARIPGRLPSILNSSENIVTIRGKRHWDLDQRSNLLGCKWYRSVVGDFLIK